jgi:outer membrane protein OmpA-like peptidoglycan-associated protein
VKPDACRVVRADAAPPLGWGLVMTSRSVRRRVGGPALWLAALALAAGLAGCSSPIEAYRSLAGFNRNDPDPATAPFTENLASAENGGYPNLGSVPDPPIVSTTLAERQKTAQGLNLQRTSTEAKDQQGSPGSPAPGPVPPPPEIPPSLAATLPAAPPPAQPIPPMRAADEPPLPGPLNSTLQTPTLATAPGLEATRPAPPQARMSPIPMPAPSALPPATVQSGNPEPSPAVPVLPVPKPSPQAAAMPPPKLPPVPTVLAAFDVPPGSAALSATATARLADIANQYKQNPGVVRVVAYAAAAVGGAEQLNSFRTALDRSQIVAKALGEAGVPAKQIQTEAAPAGPDTPTGRVEVQLLPPGSVPPGGKV